VEAALGGTIGRFETREGGREGSQRCWDVTVSPVVAEDGRVEHLVAVSHDITARQRDVAAKEAQLQQKDLLMQEVHHRVRNSLQLVQTLLQLQSRNLRDPMARRTLEDAAQRVLTIAAVHKQLYVGRSVNEADLLPYLTGLLDDLHASLAGDGAGRSIGLVAEPAVLSAEHLTSVGLVVAELVTNALKYGRGPVTVTLSVSAASARIVVEDEGDGFPASFDPASGQGLGMRLVATLAQGPEAVRVDRDVTHGRIMVDLPLS
jgi:two-component sensor histidine kinase